MAEICIECGGEMPPLNGSEENDFAFLCDECARNGDEEGKDG